MKNAALIARSISLLGKPIASICAIAVSPCGPISRAEGSLNDGPPVATLGAAAAVAPAGDGVAGAAPVEAAAGTGAGAGGAAGVDAAAGAFSGVAGAWAEDAEGAVVFGCNWSGPHLSMADYLTYF